ncbi:MAG: DNA mismatch repair protein MutS, partial [Treponema sp.]|nr:DNA mismatch repair protein MutS [Treponema sp.]
LLERIKCKTLFATHYHELTRMEHPMLKKLCMAVSEEGDSVHFLRKVIAGAAQNSYGIHVASLAGVPSPVIDRAKVLLEKIQSDASSKNLPESAPNFPQVEECKKKNEESAKKSDSWTGALFSDEEMILDEILSVDLDNTTPMQALKAVARWKKTLSGR